jgi:anti-anti-sigma regulatory factor
MNAKKRQRLNIQTDGHAAIVALDCIEIWDGADLALLREVLTELIAQDGFRTIGVNLSSVKYIPSGFFGMLFEWYEDGIEIQLHHPQPNVEQMLWFRMFFTCTSEGHFQLCDKAVRSHTPGEQVEYHKREFDTDPSSEEPVKADDQPGSVQIGIPSP